jgi:hypothetical protein
MAKHLGRNADFEKIKDHVKQSLGQLFSLNLMLVLGA